MERPNPNNPHRELIAHTAELVASSQRKIEQMHRALASTTRQIELSMKTIEEARLAAQRQFSCD